MHRVAIVRGFVGGALALFLFVGGACEVGVHYCSEDCDPCVQVCHCTTACPHTLALDFQDAYGLHGHVVLLDRRADGTWTRAYGGMIGLTLDRALGRGEHDARAIELFARNVVVANPEPFGDESDWEFVDLARTSNGLVLTFEARGPSDHSLVFLFDRAGSVVEIAVHGRS